jgi:hypothetical protein
VSSQWLSQLSLLSSKDPRSPQGPQAPQIHRSTESTEPGSSPDLLDLSYAAMQILTVLIYCFYRQLLIQHASRNVESVYSQSHLSHTLTLVRFRFDCAADFALLNLPKGKSLGRSKPATSSYAQALQHTVWDDSYYIQALLNCLL